MNKKLTIEEMEANVARIKEIEKSMDQHAKCLAKYTAEKDYIIAGSFSRGFLALHKERMDLLFICGLEG